ncbi:MAG TPA: glycosyltransferase family 2 protein [Solirubrobacterales bacterium]|nr:glycosyltransferase family 2 protein [Solirubrobacterales bacterium]
MPLAHRGASWWLLPGIDFVSSSIALVVVAILSGAAVAPALPVAPLVLVVVYSLLGVYGASPSKGGLSSADGAGWPVIRIVVAGLFAWVAALMTSISAGEQVALWAGFIALDTASRALISPYLQKLTRPERWVLVGDDATSERLRAYTPLADFATVVGTVPPAENKDGGSSGRVAALEVVERYHADRIVISSQHADDEGLLELVRAFKSIGVPVSLLPRPLDLLEAQAVTPNRVGGVPLIEVEALATQNAVPYTGPDRRAGRSTKVSVVVPAMNEGKNIGHVLERLPEGLHEVILVDGNSKDDTIEAARRAYPGIRVTTQSGRGKGDAFRTGFAAVTGNLVVMLDADGSADPAEIPRFVAALEAGADFAKGSRYLDGGGSADITWTRKLGNTCLSGTANLLHGTHFTDLCYGYNAFWARCLPFIALDVPGFEVETLINLRIAGAGMKITEVPSYEEERISGDSNLKTFRDGFRVLGTILSEARRRRSIHHEHRPQLSAETREAEATASAV